MPVYQLPDEHIIFPHPSNAEPNGLLAIGGDLKPQRILTAYQQGIFPWYGEGEPIQWWCLLPRLILYPHKITISKSTRNFFKSADYQVSYDREFKTVMNHCKTIKRKDQNGTWIHKDIEDAYIRLYEEGYAHSVEVWHQEELVGGLYGLAIGKMFCGESMFAHKPNASKFGLMKLCHILIEKQFQFIDCQQDTNHLRNLGAELVSETDFFSMLEENKKNTMISESWAS